MNQQLTQEHYVLLEELCDQALTEGKMSDAGAARVLDLHRLAQQAQTSQPLFNPNEVHFSRYGTHGSESISLADVLKLKDVEGIFARAENSGAEGIYVEVAIWNDTMGQFEAFCFEKLLGGEFGSGENDPAEVAQAIADLIGMPDKDWPLIHRMPRYEGESLRAADYQTALDAQNAVNASGLLRTMSRVVPRIWADVKANGGGTQQVNQHPIMVLYTTTLMSLAGLGIADSDVYERALKVAEEKAKD